jgi:holo-[acyl-carrier protein] synthase
VILGLGIDIVRVSRIERWLEDPSVLERFFHEDEIGDSRRRGKGAAMSLAARFAAKEAFAKALGTGLAGLRLKDIKVENDRNGKPLLALSGTAKDRLTALGVGAVHVSLTHESDAAVAVVVLEGKICSG